MIKVVICGASGKMGGFVARAANEDGSFQIVGGVDKVNNGQSFPIYTKFEDIKEKPDVIIDFSSPDVIMENIKKYAQLGINAVIGTTGWFDKIDEVKELTENKIDFVVIGPEVPLCMGLADLLEENGFKYIPESKKYNLVKGGKYYTTRNGTSLIAFKISSVESSAEFTIMYDFVSSFPS